MLSIEQIRAYIAADGPRRMRMLRLYEYYKAHNDIERRKKAEEGKPDNRLAHGFAAYIANAYTGYMFGQPVTYSPKARTGEDAAQEAMFEVVTDCFEYNDEQAENSLLGLDCAICGTAVELMYIDADGVERFARVDPVGCVAVRDSSVEAKLTALIRYYDRADIVENKQTRVVEVYEAEGVRVYEGETPDVLTPTKEIPCWFGDVPAVVYQNNSFGLGDFEIVMTQIDAYDTMQSDGVNDQEYFSDAYLAIYGATIEADDAKKMRKDRTLVMPGDSRAEWLVKQQNDATPENIKKRLNHDIFRFSGCPDMSDENFAGNSSGVALKYKLLQFENIASIKEREFKRGLQRRLELLCNYWAFHGEGAFDWRGLRIAFHRGLPENLLELSQTLSNLGTVISNQTKREMLPLDTDEETERQRIDEESEDSIFSLRERQNGGIDDPDAEDDGDPRRRIGFGSGV